MQEDVINWKIQEISLSDIIFAKDDLRSKILYEDLDALARSIRQLGLLNPITVRKADTKFELIAGYRRLKACEIAGYATVPARVIVSDDTRADLQKLHENMFREEVNPVDEGKFFKRLLLKNNWRVVDLSVQIHKSPAYVSRRINLTDADPLVVSALSDDQINISVADELIRIDDPDTRARLLHYSIKSGATVETVRAWRMQYECDIMPQPAPLTIDNMKAGQEVSNNPAPVHKYGEEPLPDRKIAENVVETRPCYSCYNKFDTRDIYVVYLCPDCKGAIEKALHGDKNNPDIKEVDNNARI